MLSKPLSFAAHLLLDNTQRTLLLIQNQAEEFDMQQFTFDFPADLFVEVKAALDEWEQSIQDHLSQYTENVPERSLLIGYADDILSDPVLFTLDSLATRLAQAYDLPSELFEYSEETIHSVCWQQSHFKELQKAFEKAHDIVPVVKPVSMGFRI